MEDDLDKRIADLEGRGPEPGGINEQYPFEDPEGLRRAMLLADEAPKRLPAMREPAPDWVGPVDLAIPFTAVAVYLVVRILRLRR